MTNTDNNTYKYSRLSSHSVGEMVASNYHFEEQISCKFYVLGLHDNYLIETDSRKFILRIYRNNWRSYDDVVFELELLAFLNRESDLVAKLVLTTSSEFLFKIESPEGARMAALFRYADGYSPESAINREEAELLARSVASIHKTSDRFTPSHSRQILDVSYLLDDSIKAIEPFIDKKASSYLNKLQDKLKSAMPEIKNEEGAYGICIGDVNATNFHITTNKKITLFDFDQCGYGYRAFEIGKFITSVHTHKNKNIIVDAFLKGYQKVRSLSEVEKEAIPYFEVISVLWVMAIHAMNVDLVGYKYLEPPFWDRRLAILKELEQAYMGSAN